MKTFSDQNLRGLFYSQKGGGGGNWGGSYIQNKPVINV